MAVASLTACSIDAKGLGDRDAGRSEFVALADSQPEGGAPDPDADGAADDATVADHASDESLASHDVSVDEAEVPPKCDVLAGDVCAKIVQLKSPLVVDGFDDEYCGVPTTTLVAKLAPYTYPSPPPSLPEVMRVRTAWTATGLAIHISVDDPKILVVPPSFDPILYLGDSIEIFAAGFAPTMGRFDTTTDVGAMQIMIAPPSLATSSGAIPGRGFIFLSGNYAGKLESKLFATHLTAKGYDVEVSLPWPMIKGIMKGAGSRIGLDFALNIADASAGKRDLYAVLFNKKIGASPYCMADVAPFCDDRTWCTPLLE
ncbi:MAG: hypothetical protein NVS3B20_05170 [Polyangiales bacterium]